MTHVYDKSFYSSTGRFVCFFAFLFFAFFITEKKRNLLTFDMLSYVSKSHGSVARPIMRGRRMWSDHVTP